MPSRLTLRLNLGMGILPGAVDDRRPGYPLPRFFFLIGGVAGIAVAI